jgi:hypothetical protein
MIDLGESSCIYNEHIREHVEVLLVHQDNLITDNDVLVALGLLLEASSEES